MNESNLLLQRYEGVALDNAPSNVSEAVEAGVFTRYVRALANRSRGLEELVEELLDALREALIRELRRRSLWTCPPSYLGVGGWPTWTAECDDGAVSPLDELVQDAYLFLFDSHLRRYLIQLERHGAIDGLVVLDLRNYFSDRQRAHDPLGFHLFEVLRTAVLTAIEAGQLHVARGDTRVRNETCVATTPGAGQRDTAPREELVPVVAGWSEDLLPELVVAAGAQRRRVEQRLRARLRGLGSKGVEVFRFKDLLDVLKDDVRARWAGLWHQGGQTSVDPAGTFCAAARAEHADSFLKLVDGVSRRIETHPGRKRTRLYLARLWSFLRYFALGDEERLPSYRRQAEILDIPRERLPGLYDKLAGMIRRCQKTFRGNVAEFDERHRLPRSSHA